MAISVSSLKLVIRERAEKGRQGVFNTSTVQVRFYLNRVAHYVPTGIKVETAIWNPEAGKIKIGNGLNQKEKEARNDLNTQLEAFLTRSRQAIIEAERDGHLVTASYLKGVLNPRVELPKGVVPALQAPAEPSVIEAFRMFIDYRASDLKTSKATVASYKTTIRHLEGFAKAQKVKLPFEALTPQMVEKLITWLRGHNLGSARISAIIKNLKVACKWAKEHGHTFVAQYPLFKKPRVEETDFVYLTETELETLAATSLPTHLERVRDLFVLQASTGLRYSDLANLRPENRIGNTLSIVTIKTSDKLQIPLLPAALRIYAKYEGKGLPPVISNQPYNREIKEACYLAGLVEEVPITILKKGQRIDTSMPKWQKVSSHTARRTFIIHALERGIRPEVLMRVTGHKDIKTMHRYVKITAQVVEDEFARAFGRPAETRA